MDALQNRIILVTRRTRLEDLVARLNTVEQARFYVEHLGADFSDYETEHAVYHRAVESAESTLRLYGRVQRLERGLAPNFLFPPDCRACPRFCVNGPLAGNCHLTRRHHEPTQA